MKALYQHLLLEFRCGWRNRSLLLIYYLFPLAFYLMMGLVMTELIPEFRSFMIPAMILFTILSGEILGLPNPLVEAREAGVLRSYRINGISATSALGVSMLTAIIHSVVASTLIALSAPTLFGAIPPASWSAMVLVTLVAASAYAGLGALIGVVSTSSRTTIMWSQLVYMPSFLLGGVMIPSEMLPATMSRVGLFMPTTHAMYAYRALAYGEAVPHHVWSGLVTLMAGGALAFALAIFLFRWDTHYNEPLRYPFLAATCLLPYALWLFS